MTGFNQDSLALSPLERFVRDYVEAYETAIERARAVV